jgi:FixJ family two-component response regulator
MTPQATVFVIDDDPGMRAAFESLLRSVGHAVRTFSTTEAFREAAHPDSPACLVLDVRLPGASGLEFQAELARRGIAMPVVFVSAHADVAMSVAAMKAGALEFLTKPVRDQDLLDAVHRGLAQDRERRAAHAEQADLARRADHLTPREREVVGLVAGGLPNKLIAARLDLSEVTVKVHRAQAMKKLKAASLPDLVRIADGLGITQKP